MQREIFLTAVSVAVAAFSVSAIAQDDVVTLQPAGAWVLNYDEDSCALRREFRSDAHSAMLEMRQFEPSGGLRFTILSKDLPLLPVSPRYWVGFPQNSHFAGQFLSIDTMEHGRGIVFHSENGLGDRSEGGNAGGGADGNQGLSRMLGFERVFESPLTLETGTLEAPAAALQSCSEELLEHWGLDVEEHANLSRKARSNRASHWIEKDVAGVWPSPRALRDQEQSFLNVRLIVNAEGRVDECHIQSGIGSETMRAWTCERLREMGRFDPALDATGEPIRSYWTTVVSHQLN